MPHACRIASLFAFAAGLATLGGCERTPGRADEAPAPAASPAHDDADGDNGFEVQVTLSDAAARTLARAGENVVVAADYFGYPTVAAQQRELPGTSEGWLTLHEVKQELEGAGTATFAPVALDPARLQLLERARPQLLVNVYSGRRSADDNLLDCGTFQDALAVAVRKGVHIECRLITE